MSQVDKVVVTASSRAPRHKAILETPPGKTDVQVYVFGWARQAGIRTVRTYLQAVVGFLVAGGVGAINSADIAQAVGVEMPANQFLSLLLASASLAVAPAVVAFLQNAIELLTRLDSPETRA